MIYLEHGFTTLSFPRFLRLWLAPRDAGELRIVCILPTARSDGRKPALVSMSVRALSLCPAPCGAGLPSWHPLQQRAKLGTSRGLPFLGQSTRGVRVERRSAQRVSRSVTIQLLGAGLGGVKIRIPAWLSLWIWLSM